jgi:hypothetical protein
MGASTWVSFWSECWLSSPHRPECLAFPSLLLYWWSHTLFVCTDCRPRRIVTMGLPCPFNTVYSQNINPPTCIAWLDSGVGLFELSSNVFSYQWSVDTPTCHGLVVTYVSIMGYWSVHCHSFIWLLLSTHSAHILVFIYLILLLHWEI